MKCFRWISQVQIKTSQVQDVRNEAENEVQLYYYLQCSLLWLEMNHTLDYLIQTSCLIHGI